MPGGEADCQAEARHFRSHVQLPFLRRQPLGCEVVDLGQKADVFESELGEFGVARVNGRPHRIGDLLPLNPFVNRR